MKVLLFINSEKDLNGEYSAKIKALLNKHGIDFDCLSEDQNSINSVYDAMIVVGGDGTLLRRTEIANLNKIPIIGINSGRLGFLSEFETDEAENAIVLLKNGKLVKDERLTLKITCKNKVYYALNEAGFSRLYEENKRLIVSLDVKIGSAEMQSIIGDGVIVSTPTGSTAYSLSAGGAILEPHINACCITPVAAHSFSARPIVYSADNVCTVRCEGENNVGLFIDGRFVDSIDENETVSISRAENNTVFLRKRDFDFFTRLNKKMQDR